jgi:PKD repeat protein
MKNILIGLFVIIFFTACVQKYDICENPKVTGDFIVKESYPEQDSVRISTKNIRINNKTITEFKKLRQINTEDIFNIILFNASNISQKYVLNDTSINFKIPSGQYRLDYYTKPFTIGDYTCDYSYIQYNATSHTFNVLDNSPLMPIPEFNCPESSTISVIYFSNTSQNATSFEWNFGDPGSGSNNTSTLVSPTHDFKEPNLTSTTKTYTVTLTAKNSFTTQSISKPITIAPTPPPPKSLCRITKIEINNGTANGFNQAWDPLDGPDTYVAIITDGAVALNLKNNLVNNVQLNMLPLTFNLNTPFEIGNRINNVYKNLDIVIMDDDTPNNDQQMGSALFNANLQLLTNCPPSITLNTINSAFTITLFFDYIN